MAMKARMLLNVLGASLLADLSSFLSALTSSPFACDFDAAAWRKFLFYIFPSRIGRCDSERLKGLPYLHRALYIHFFDLHRNTPTHPC